MKQCTKCGEWKQESEYAVRTDKYKKRIYQYLRKKCKQCENIDQRKWRKNNKELCIVYTKTYYKKHRESILEYIAAKYKNRDKEKAREYTRKYAIRNIAKGYYSRHGVKPSEEVLELKEKHIVLRRTIKALKGGSIVKANERG